MTSTSNVGRVAGVLSTAATTYAKGSAGIGLALAQRGYGLARTEVARRKASSTLQPARSRTRKVSVRTRRFIVFGGIAAVLAAVAVTIGRRRHEIQPPADAPPSLADYAGPGDRVNGSAPAQVP